MKTNDEALLKIKYNVLRTVSRLAFEGRLEEERDNIPFKLIPVQRHSSAAVYTRRERLSARESVWQKVNVRLTAIQTTSYRLSMQPVRSADCVLHSHR